MPDKSEAVIAVKKSIKVDVEAGKHTHGVLVEEVKISRFVMVRMPEQVFPL
jgi:hypothetical protein